MCKVLFSYLRFKALIVLIFTVGLNHLVSAQRILNFSVAQIGSSVSYNFTYRSGSSCTGYQLNFSTDSLNFTAVQDYAGVCGASGTDEFFSGTHTTPKMNAWNYYRIQMGNLELSEIRKIYVSADGSLKATVFPNPYIDGNQQLQFRISGANNLRLQGFVYDANGYDRQFIDTITNGDTGTINAQLFDNGLYILWLTDGSKLYKGKFLVMR